ncbi:phospholipase D family protein [Nocardioides sp. NPDC051685]|uniref:phospholipase D family protein n=1 Tax=Nocardioides sp. NPDC051685 TaxID=3364334 RepID=UPI00378778DE
MATTFTLDLTACLIPALALSSYSMSGAVPDPVSALDAIRKTVGRLDVFCQAGSIGVPAQAPELAAFLEPMVHQVAAPSKGLFHPKVWLAHYVHDDLGPILKLLVLSRNLTHDNTWDIIVSLQSEKVGTSPRPQNDPLRDFLASLPGRAVHAPPADRRRRIENLADLSHRAVWSLPNGADSVAFHFIDGGRTPPTLASRRQLVISPFINDGGLKLLAGSSSTRTVVVSRADELEKLSPSSVAAIEAYIMDPVAGVIETSDEADGATSLGVLGALHAKAYVLETDGQRKPRVILGSANATDVAFASNVEFLIEFVGAWKTFGIDAWLGDEAEPTPFRAMIERYEPTGGSERDHEEEARWNLENQLRRIGTIPHKAVAEALNDGTFELRLQAAEYRLARQYRATIRPLTRPGTDLKIDAAGEVALAFPGLAKAEVTGFFVVTLEDVDESIEASCVILSALENDPADRLDAVIAAQLDTPEKFIRFLYLLMSLGDPSAIEVATSGAGTAGFFGDLAKGSGVLELILKGLAANPSVITEIDRVITALAELGDRQSVLPEGFADLWPVVLEAQRLVIGAEE